MDPLSITVSVSSLIVVCARVIKLSSELSDAYKSASFILSAITAECSVISASLVRLQNMLLSQPSKADALAESLETALLGCALTMSVLYDQVGGLMDETKEGEKRPKKFKFVLEHDHLKEMLQQIRGQQISISLLLQTIQIESLNEVKQSIQDYNIVLQQMVKRGRSLWQANQPSAQNRDRNTVVSSDEADSVFELSSIITDTRFDFDDQVLDSKAYRRALANLRSAKQPRNSAVSGTIPSEPMDPENVSHPIADEETSILSVHQHVTFEKAPKLPGSDAEEDRPTHQSLEERQHVESHPTDSTYPQIEASIVDPFTSSSSVMGSAPLGEMTRRSKDLNIQPGDSEIDDRPPNPPEPSSMTKSPNTGTWKNFPPPSPTAKVLSQRFSMYVPERGVLFTAISVDDFLLDRTDSPAGFPYLTYVCDEIFDVVGDTGDFWLARNRDDSLKRVGWIWNKHFERLDQEPEKVPSLPAKAPPPEERRNLPMSFQRLDDTTSIEQLDKRSIDQSRSIILEERLENIPTRTSVTPVKPQPRMHRIMSVLSRLSGNLSPMNKIKLVAVGDSFCGKTSMLRSFARGVSVRTQSNDFTIFDIYEADVEVDGQPIRISLWDTAGLESSERLRSLSYSDSHAVLICFSLSSVDSWMNVSDKWKDEVWHYMAGIPVILVGCKKDLRENPSANPDNRNIPVSTIQGEELCQEIGAMKYLECSAETCEGIQQVFEVAIRAAILAHSTTRRKRRDR